MDLLLVVLHREEPYAVGGCTFVVFMNKLAGTPDLELGSFLDSFFSRCHGGQRGDAEEEGVCLRRTVKAVRFLSISTVADELKLRRLPESSFLWEGDASGGRWAVSGEPLPFLRVEWRPFEASGFFYSSRPKRLKGGRSASARRSHPCSPACRWQRWCGKPMAPSGFVPGGDRFGPMLLSRVRIGLRFSSSFWGPLCKLQGPYFSFSFFLGPCVSYGCTVTLKI